jgi:hypothetical protein
MVDSLLVEEVCKCCLKLLVFCSRHFTLTESENKEVSTTKAAAWLFNSVSVAVPYF